MKEDMAFGSGWTALGCIDHNNNNNNNNNNNKSPREIIPLFLWKKI